MSITREFAAPAPVVEDKPAPEPGRRFGVLHRTGLALVVVLSVGLRVWEFLSPRALWLDEQYIAIVIRDGTYGSLVGFLPLIQSAPVWWLWIEKALMSVSVDDQVLRAPTLVASCAGVVAALLLARRMFRLPGQFALVILLGVTPTMVYYATIMKPYGIDAAVTTVLLWLTVRAVQDRRQAAFWYAAGALVWLSQTAVFVVATSGAVLLWLAVRDDTWRRLAGPLATAAVSAAVLYAVHVKPNTDAALMPWWWARFAPLSMAPRPWRFSVFMDWLFDTSLTNIALILPARGMAQAGVMLALLVLGGRLLWRRDRTVAAVVLGPVAVAFTLAVLHLYPLWERVTVWLVPALLVLLCVVVDEATPVAVRLVRGRVDRFAVQAPLYVAGALAVAVIIGAGFTGPALRTDEGWLLSRHGKIREAFRFVAREAGPADRVYVHRYSVAAATWYGPECGLRWDGQYDHAGGVPGFPADAVVLPDPAPGTLTWLLYGVNAGELPRSQHAELQRRGEVVVDRFFSQVRVTAFRARPVPPGADPGAGDQRPVLELRVTPGKQIVQEPKEAFMP